jgi:peptidoglycan/xylan/chitin deacetylase (PgdA/CDA1 family)
VVIDDAMPDKRIVVFTGDFSYSVRRGILEIDATVPDASWLVVIHAPRKPFRRLMKNQWQNLKKNGWRWIPYQVSEVRRRLVARRSTSLATSGPGRQFTEQAIASQANVTILRVANIHSEVSRDAVSRFKPSLGLCIAAPLLHRSLFCIPALGTINLHKGRVPAYRGMPPAFWELWNDEKSVGCTVHWVTDALDAGGIVCETTIDRKPFSTPRGLQIELDETGIELMRKAVQDIFFGIAHTKPQSTGGTTYRKPTLAQIEFLARNLEGCDQQGRASWRRIAKNAVWRGTWIAWKSGLGVLVVPRITVLLYHRVSDDARDNLTVGVEQFDRQMALLRTYCKVLSIEQVMDSEVITRERRPLVAVTFDDGYLDNFTNAAPILMRHGIPAAFFVSTGIVDTNRRFPHDERRGNRTIPVMRWDHMRTMRDWGFTIGSHSVSHNDCAAEPAETVREELAQTLNYLDRELGIDNILFAYPYGGRQNMTPECLEFVKQAGYSGCLSAYGGTNIGTVDRYNVLRRGFHWEFSDRAFLFECLGLR